MGCLVHPNTNTMAFERRCISACRVARRRNSAAITPSRALHTERITTLGASSGLCSGALAVQHRAGWLARSRVVFGLAVAIVSLQACAVARSAGGEFASGAVARLEESDSVVVALQRRLVDSAAVVLEADFRRAVLDPSRESWSEMRQGLRDEADSLAGRLDVMLREVSEETLPAGIERSASLMEIRMGDLGEAFAARFAAALGEGVSTQLRPATDSLLASMMRATVLGLETDLKPAVHALMLDVRDSLELRIGDVDRAVAGSQTVGELRYALYGAGTMAHHRHGRPSATGH